MSEHIQSILSLGLPEGWEWLVILVVAVLVFGKNLPAVARSIGRSLTEFKKGLKEGEQSTGELGDEVKKVKDDVVQETKKAGSQDKSSPDA